jgi:hypothetical protein
MASLKATVKAILDQNRNVFVDKLTAKKNGTVEVKRAYFYHNGQTAETWAAKVQAALDDAGETACKVIGHRDDWRALGSNMSDLVAVIARVE